MADARTRAGMKSRSRQHSVEEFLPSSAWTEDSKGHYLLVDLPGFKWEEVKIQVDPSGLITIQGERLVSDAKYIYFEKTYTAPENADIEKMTGNFSGEILFVTVPKISVPEEETSVPEEEHEFEEEDAEQNPNPSIDENQHDLESKKETQKRTSSISGFRYEMLRKWGQEAKPPLKWAMKMVMNNKGIVATAVLAFSMGVYITRKFESADGE